MKVTEIFFACELDSETVTKIDIQKEVRAGRGKSRLGELEKGENKQLTETLSITKSEYKKQMQILYDLMPKVNLW